MGRLRPEVQPLALLYTILAGKVPLYIPFIEKKVTFSHGRLFRNIIITGPFKYLMTDFPTLLYT